MSFLILAGDIHGPLSVEANNELAADVGDIGEFGSDEAEGEALMSSREPFVTAAADSFLRNSEAISNLCRTSLRLLSWKGSNSQT